MRVHILLARAADTAVVIRRGPEKIGCVLGWDRAGDRIEVGQWLKARIHERRCDLSPDGRHLLYFATDYRGVRGDFCGWQAISRAPYLKALGFWPMTDNAYGGGQFDSNESYWLRRVSDPHALDRDATDLRRVAPSAAALDNRGYFELYDLRLQRDGWTLVDSQHTGRFAQADFRKSTGGPWSLHKSVYSGFGRRKGDPRRAVNEDHALLHRDGRAIPLPDWSWADIDAARERLVWVEHGRLMAAPIADAGLGTARELYDFNPLAWQSLQAPY
ncbi:hypothetical protein [Lysobacter enzymogenes]|uniref:hypothetical protein n=1 Tax=Lysobacter enzymogenes TaxID=69 RepID=UPI001AF167B1|nr:hypothetical protein [Lysobacter enzymogenes]QQQ01702.1 hypothetical protein JHW41_01570 [Lysobacter enzymogenes]